MRDIKELRKEIDGIDKELVKLFEKRMAVVEEVATYKIENNKPLKDPARESELIEKNVSLLNNHKYDRLLSVFFKDLMEYSRTHQKYLMKKETIEFSLPIDNPKVVYQGVEGSFSSIALKRFFKEGSEQVHVRTFEETFKTLYNKEADYGILPIENSSTGAINEVYDLLLKYQMHIVGDLYLPIRHHLIGFEGTDLSEIEAVYSHEQGFKQSKKFLSHYQWQQYSYTNTAKSVMHVKELQKYKYAAIGSKEAADVYGLSVLKENIHDHDYNTTRFVVLALKPIKVKSANKISLVVRVSHEPKALFSVLEIIANHNINMLKIESRPIPDKPWAYMFYIDIEGSVGDVIVDETLEAIEAASNSVLMLGNYYSRNGVNE